MGVSHGQLQSQSDSGKGETGDSRLPGIGFNLTGDGNFDLDGKGLTKNIQQDNAIKSKINSKAEKNEAILRDGTQSMKGNLDMENDITKVKNKIINLANGTADDDAVNLAQLKSFTDSHKNDYHLRQSFRFYENFGDNVELTVHNNINVPNHDHHDPFIIQKEGNNNPTFSVETASSSIRMTSILPAGIYTAIFEIFSYFYLGPLINPYFLYRESLITDTNDDGNLR